jgi:predicted metal-binding membrane protein
MGANMNANPSAVSSTHGLSKGKLLSGRRVLIVELVFITVLAWAYMFYLYAAMPPLSAAQMAEPNLQPWTPVTFVMMFIMWAVMMVAMMLPSALPTILLFAKLKQNQTRQFEVILFVSAYVALWTAFSFAATLLQWGLHTRGLLSVMDATNTPILGGVVLIIAGVYQWLPLKFVCLNRCRSPLSFLIARWKDGAWGAWQMGLQHGFYCVACCWALMLVLFVVGVMNLLWIVILSLYVLLEKLFFKGESGVRIAGAMLVFWGAWLIAGR